MSRNNENTCISLVKFIKFFLVINKDADLSLKDKVGNLHICGEIFGIYDAFSTVTLIYNKFK
jgi:hypothetical protein